ncbi:MAG: hypothetical protein K0M48_10995 [Thiobacillus sp.]|nr:hypothetical protein [Thiobacillus sp.]
MRYLEQATNSNQLDEPQIFKNADNPRFQSSLDWKLYVLREAHELMWILKGLKMHVPKGVDEKLQMLVGGSDFAALDSHTESRNTQFELRIASYFCQAGWKVDLSTKTDVIATSRASKWAFYVECKRIASEKRIQENLLKAKSQLLQRMPETYDGKKPFGIIAVDVTKVAFEHNGLTWGLTSDHSRDVVQDKLKTIADAIARTFGLFKDFPDLLGCWLQIHIPSLIMHPPATVTRFSSTIVPSSGLEEDASCARYLLELIANVGVLPDPRALPPEKMERRTRVLLSAGTAYSFDMQVLKALLSGGAMHDKGGNDRIAGITIGGVEHEFSFLELEMLPSKLLDEVRQNSDSKNLGEVALTLIMKMYLQRYPYANLPSPSTEG